jgi:D-sedoheptulose 7-phosphate isomerase
VSVLKGLAETAPVDQIAAYFAELNRVCSSVRVSDAEGQPMSLQAGFDWVADSARRAHAAGNKMILIGNGGSATIASHQAIEFQKNGGVRALALNDGAALTALANDFGYANVFAEQLRMLGRRGDMLVAISSSGQSTNILKGVEAARAHGMAIATFSGFQPDNLLRGRGDVNFYVNSNQYGFVEIAHHALIQPYSTSTSCGSLNDRWRTRRRIARNLDRAM